MSRTKAPTQVARRLIKARAGRPVRCMCLRDSERERKRKHAHEQRQRRRDQKWLHLNSRTCTRSCTRPFNTRPSPDHTPDTPDHPAPDPDQSYTDTLKHDSRQQTADNTQSTGVLTIDAEAAHTHSHPPSTIHQSDRPTPCARSPQKIPRGTAPDSGAAQTIPQDAKMRRCEEMRSALGGDPSQSTAGCSPCSAPEKSVRMNGVPARNLALEMFCGPAGI